MIDLRGVSFAYGPRQGPALHAVDLAVQAGEVVGVAGVNGAGKTTLLRLVAGLLPPTAGRLTVAGARDRAEIRTQVVLCPDEAGIYSFLTPVEAGHLLRQVSAGWDEERWSSLLDLLEIPRHKLGGQLSRGQKTRLRLAQALSQPAPVLVLDEPLAGIDPASRERIAGALAREIAASGRTVLIATHELREIEALLDRLLVLRDGALAVDAPAEEIRSSTGGSIDGFLRLEAGQ